MGAEQSKSHAICWQCATRADDVITECPKCARIFHSKCLTRSELAAKRTWVCSICANLEPYDYIDNQTDLKALPAVVNRLLDITLFKQLNDSLQKTTTSKSAGVIDFLISTFGLARNREMIEHYRSFKSFLVDVHWILDYCSNIFPNDSKTANIIKLLKELIDEEIEGLRKCVECYLNAVNEHDDWFTMACDVPHLVAWVNLKGCNFWPVKIMSVNGRQLNVRFFGDHTHANVSAAACHLFSENSPGKSAGNRGKLYNIAIQEVNMYIENLRKKFGSFNYAKPKMEFDPKLLVDYVLQMVPGTATFRKPEQPNATMFDQLQNASPEAVGHLSKFNSINDDDDDDDKTNAESSAKYSQSSNIDAAVATSNETESTIPSKKRRLPQTRASIENSPKSDDSVLLTDDNATLKQEILDLTERNAILALELKNAERKGKSEIVQLIKKMEKECDEAIEKATVQCKMEYNKHIEAAKKMQICAACDTTKPTDTFFICSDSCLKRFSEKQLQK